MSISKARFACTLFFYNLICIFQMIEIDFECVCNCVCIYIYIYML